MLPDSYYRPKVIAELCCNHMGNFEVAQQMIVAARNCGADVAKFQKRCPRELLTAAQYDAPHPNPHHSYGRTYGEHRESLEFTIDQHVDLAAFCKEVGIEYGTSVWDMTSAREVVEAINPSMIKVPSACNNNAELLTYLRTQYKGDIHVSLGMTTLEEYAALAWEFRAHMDRVVAYHCTSGYPVPFSKLWLAEIPELVSQWSRVGFSGHHLGIAVDVAAYTLGASYVERHFTLDRTLKGTDHAVSLEPAGLQKLCRDLNAAYAALQFRPQEMDPIEVEQREKLKYRPEGSA